MLKKGIKEDPFQKPLKAEDVIKTDAELGQGTYARVFEIEHCKARFAAKRLRFSFVKNASQDCIRMFVKKITDECRFQNQCVPSTSQHRQIRWSILWGAGHDRKCRTT